MPKWVINEQLCKGCSLCIGRCPLKILAISDRITINGFHPASIIDEQKCTSCAICARSCPDIAIEIYR